MPGFRSRQVTRRQLGHVAARVKKGYSCKRVRRSLRAQRDETDFRHTQEVINVLKGWEDGGECDLYFFDEADFRHHRHFLMHGTR